MDLSFIERVSEELYTSTDPVVRREAEERLNLSVASPEAVAQCIAILGQSKSPYALTLATSTITRMLTTSWTVFSPSNIAECRSALLRYLYRIADIPSIPRFVYLSAYQTLARIVKLSYASFYTASSSSSSSLSSSSVSSTSPSPLKPTIPISSTSPLSLSSSMGIPLQSSTALSSSGTSEGRQLPSPIAQDLSSFISSSPNRQIVALRLLESVVEEMSTVQTGVRITTSVHARSAIQFRDSELYDILTCGLDAMRNVVGAQGNNGGAPDALRLVKSCLAFNFLGTNIDETCDDTGTVQFPMTWRPLFDDASFVQLFFDVYRLASTSSAAWEVQSGSNALECAAQVLSARKMVYSSEAVRLAVLQRVMDNVKSIIMQEVGIGVPENHHALSRLISRIKTNFQLTNLTGTQGWNEWLEVVFSFTQVSLQAWKRFPNSVHYLMSFWSKLTSALVYSSSPGDTSYIFARAPAVLQTYIETRLDSVNASVASSVSASGGDDDEPLASEEVMVEQLSFVSGLARCNYVQTTQSLVRMLERFGTGLQRIERTPYRVLAGQGQLAALRVMYGQLAWLVHIAAALVAGRQGVSSTDESDECDGELAGRVFGLMVVAGRRAGFLEATDAAGYQASIAAGSYESYLEVAFVAFCQSFRHSYIGEQAASSSRAYARLEAFVGLADSRAALSFVVDKVAGNLQRWKTNAAVTGRTLAFFQDLCGGYCSSRLLAALPAAQAFLLHHSNAALRFPATKEGLEQTKSFYTSLGRLLSLEGHRDDFATFALPLDAELRALLRLLVTPADLRAHRDAAARAYAVLGGLFAAASSTVFFQDLFEWLHPQYTPLLTHGVAVFAADADTMELLMSLVAEVCNNRSNRIRFDVSSPNGILLFKEICSPLVAAYAHFLATQTVPDEKLLWKFKYRGTVLCLEPFANCIAGEYLNFSVFTLYHDPCFSTALEAELKLLFSLPADDIVRFDELATACYSFLECLTKSQAAVVCSLEPVYLEKLFYFILKGLQFIEMKLKTSCCCILGNIFQFYINARHKAQGNMFRDAADAFQHNLTLLPQVFLRLFETLFNIILTTDCQFLYTLSRPLQLLYQIAPDQLALMSSSLVAVQPAEQIRARLALALRNFTQAIAPQKDESGKECHVPREAFNQAVIAFSNEVKPIAAGCVFPSTM